MYLHLWGLGEDHYNVDDDYDNGDYYDDDFEDDDNDNVYDTWEHDVGDHSNTPEVGV